MNATAARKIKTFTGWTNEARWLASHDLTSLEVPSRLLPRAAYSFSLTTSVYTDAQGEGLYCLVEVAHRRFEVWLVSRADVAAAS